MKVNLEKCVCGIQGETDNWPRPLTGNTRSNLFLNSCLIQCSFSQELQASLQSTKNFSWHVWWLLEIGLHPELLSTWRPHTKLPNTVRDLWEHSLTATPEGMHNEEKRDICSYLTSGIKRYTPTWKKESRWMVRLSCNHFSKFRKSLRDAIAANSTETEKGVVSSTVFIACNSYQMIP